MRTILTVDRERFMMQREWIIAREIFVRPQRDAIQWKGDTWAEGQPTHHWRKVENATAGHERMWSWEDKGSPF